MPRVNTHNKARIRLTFWGLFIATTFGLLFLHFAPQFMAWIRDILDPMPVRILPGMGEKGVRGRKRGQDSLILRQTRLMPESMPQRPPKPLP